MTVPAGHNYALQLYVTTDLSSDPVAWTLLDSSDSGGSSTEIVLSTDDNLSSFSGDENYVVVVTSNGYYNCPSAGSYTLAITAY